MPKRINNDGLVWCYGHKEYLPEAFFGTHNRVRTRTHKKQVVGTCLKKEYNVLCEHCSRVNSAYYNLKRLYKAGGLSAVEDSVLALEEAYKCKLAAYQKLFDKVGGK